MSKLNDLDKLHIFDTIHDFWVERGTNNEETKQEKIRIYLVDFIKSFIRAGNNVAHLNDVLSYLTNTKIQSFHANNLSYERNIEKYYETISSEFKPRLYANTKETITYGEIIRSAGDRKSANSPWAKYKASYGIHNVLKIEVGDDQEYTSFGMVQKRKKENVIADFILNYMFPGKESNKNTFYLTSDANLKILRKIFKEIKEVHSLITPANIADSANTKLQPFIQNRNDYIFPVNKPNLYEFRSNIYTKSSDCKLSFTNNKFSDKNPYGFLLNIQHKKNNYAFRFSEKEQNGPSVNYLGDLITTDPRKKPEDPERSMLNINTLLDDTSLIKNGILLDLKRTGDYEQVNSAVTISNDLKTPFVILTTVDILCSLYARINQQNNIFHNGETMTLYRFAKGKVDEDVLELQRKKYQLMETAENIIILRDLQDNHLFKDIEQCVQHWNRFFKDGQFKSNNPKQTESKKVENIVTFIIKIRVSDILKKLNVLHAEMEKIQIPDKKTMESYLTEIEKILKSIETSKGKQEMLAIKKKVQNIENVIKRFENIGVNTILNRTFELNSNTMKHIHEGKNPLELDYMVYEDNNHPTHPLFKHTGHSNVLNFSNASYNHVFNKIYNFDRILSSSSSRNRDKKLYDRLSGDANDNYFNYVNSIYDSFFDKSLGEEFYNILNPPETENESVMEWYSNVEIQLEKCLARNDPSTIYMVNYFNEESSRGGGTKRKRDASSLSKSNSKKHNYYHSKRKEALDTIQCRELSDLLRSIAGIAAAYIESIITNQFGESVPSIETLVAYLQQEEIFVYVLEVVQEIEIVWIDGILNIQRNINDAYEYVPTESEYLILNMLSYYYKDQISNDFDDGNMQLNKDFYYIFQRDDKIRPSKRRTSVQGTTKMNDIGGLILNNPKNIPAEIINLLTLTLIDNTMQGDREKREETTKKGYFYHLIHHSDIPMNFFDNQSSWNDLPRYLYVYISYIVHGHSEILKQFRKISGGGGKTKKRKTKIQKRNRETRNKRNV